MSTPMRRGLVLPFLVATLLLTAPSTSRPGAAQDAKKPADQPLTLDTLRTMLENMGYEIEDVKNKDGKVAGFRLKIEQEGWTHRVVVDISPSGQWVWLTSWLTTPPKGTTVPPDIYRKMLEANFTNGLPFFSIDPTDGAPRVQTPLLNRGVVTPAVMRRQVDGLLSTVRQTAGVWDPEKWKDGKEKAPGPNKEEKPE
ncbi:MAG: hypothetical protein JWO38_1518 [Gemmataceae bacterium]|nr:hypothetical protein [Gemmataceae bacterium]